MKRAYDIQPTGLAYRVYQLNTTTWVWEDFMYLRYQDLVSSKITLQRVDEDTCELSITREEVFNQLHQAHKLAPLAFERLVYEDITDEISETAEYNPLFFMNFGKIAVGFEDGIPKKEFTIGCYDWKGFYEKRKIFQHTKFYNPLPPEEPDDFNKIVFTNGDFPTILNNAYRDNMGYEGNLPKQYKKGIDNTLGAGLRYVNGYWKPWFFYSDFTFPKYTTVQVEKSILDFKRTYYDYMQNNLNNYKIFHTRAKIVNGLVNPVHLLNSEITIDNETNNDQPVSWSDEYNETVSANFIIVNSDAYDTKFKVTSDIKDRDSTSFEVLVDSSISDETIDWESYLETRGRENLELNKPIEVQSFEVEFSNMLFLRDFYVGDILNLLNFAGYSGKYSIAKITEVIEGNYVSYVIDEMTKF